MKIALTGPHRSGKTTLTTIISREFKLPHLKHDYTIPFTKRGLKPSDVIDFTTRFKIQQEIYDMYDISSHDEFVTDRCYVDFAAYIIANHDPYSRGLNLERNKFVNKCLRQMSKFSHIILVPSHEYIVDFNPMKGWMNDEYLKRLNMTFRTLLNTKPLKRLNCLVLKPNQLAYERFEEIEIFLNL